MGEPLIRTLADVQAFQRIPLEQRVDTWTVYEVVARGAGLNPAAAALHYLLDASPEDTPTTITYAQFMGQVHQTANLLRRLFGGKDGVVGVLLPLVPESYLLTVGGPSAGILCPVNPALKAPQLAAILNSARTEVLVSLGPTPGFDIWETARQVLALVPGIKHVLQVRGPGGAVDADKDFTALTAKERADGFSFQRALRPDDTAIYCPTGGSTGLPKLAKLSHRGIAYKCHAFGWVLGYRSGDVKFSGTPLFHSGGIVYRTLTAMAHGVTTVIVSPHGFRAPKSRENFWKLAERYRLTELGVPPTMLAALLACPSDGADLSSLKKYANTGSTGLPVATARAFEERFGVRISGNYGLTENTTSAALSPREIEPRYGASGIRIPYTQIKTAIVDRRGVYLRDGGPGEPGVLALKGPGVISGYVEESLNRNLFFPDGWLNTGDLGRIDPDGYVWVTGRLKDVIIRGGNNIDPSLIEETLLQHAAVELAAAVGKPDAYAGELPVGYVQLKPGASASAEEIKEFARKNIPERGAAPVDVHILDKIPLTDTGKIFKPPLRCDAARRVFDAALANLAPGVSVSVEVNEDAASGMRVRVVLASGDRRDPAAEAQARAIMDAHTTGYDVVWRL